MIKLPKRKNDVNLLPISLPLQIEKDATFDDENRIAKLQKPNQLKKLEKQIFSLNQAVHFLEKTDSQLQKMIGYYNFWRGKKLKYIKENNLHKEVHGVTWQYYIKNTFHISRSYAGRLIQFSELFTSEDAEQYENSKLMEIMQRIPADKRKTKLIRHYIDRMDKDKLSFRAVRKMMAGDFPPQRKSNALLEAPKPDIEIKPESVIEMPENLYNMAKELGENNLNMIADFVKDSEGHLSTIHGKRTVSLVKYQNGNTNNSNKNRKKEKSAEQLADSICELIKSGDNPNDEVLLVDLFSASTLLHEKAKNQIIGKIKGFLIETAREYGYPSENEVLKKKKIKSKNKL